MGKLAPILEVFAKKAEFYISLFAGLLRVSARDFGRFLSFGFKHVNEKPGPFRRAKLCAFAFPFLSSVYLGKYRGKAVVIASCALVFSCTYLLFETNSVTYEYSYHGRVLGTARTKEAVQQAVAEITQLQAPQASADATLIALDPESDIEIKEVRQIAIIPAKADEPEKIVEVIKSQPDIEVKAYQISINGTKLGLVASAKEAEKVSAEALSQTIALVGLGDAAAYKEIGFEENFQILELRAPKTSLTSSDALIEEILTDRLLHIRTVEDASYEAEIPFETVYLRDTAELYEGEIKVVSEGVVGKKNVLGEIVRLDGAEIERTELETKIISQPKTQTAERGTKPAPERIGTGTYILPIEGLVSSVYGPRWGRIHEGVDFAVDIGTDVIAADTGKVEEVGYQSGYGLTVTIDHGDGVISLYGHLSETLVEPGQIVRQGDLIAKSGNTGFSTGPHLHFALFRFGQSFDPEPVLPDLTFL